MPVEFRDYSINSIGCIVVLLRFSSEAFSDCFTFCVNVFMAGSGNGDSGLHFQGAGSYPAPRWPPHSAGGRPRVYSPLRSGQACREYATSSIQSRIQIYF